MASFRIEHYGFSFDEGFAGIIKCFLVLLDSRKPFMAHSVGWKKPHCPEDFVEYRIVEHIGTSKEVHPSVCQLTTHAQRVVQTVLVVCDNNYRGAVRRNVFYSYDMFFLEI